MIRFTCLGMFSYVRKRLPGAIYKLTNIRNDLLNICPPIAQTTRETSFVKTGHLDLSSLWSTGHQQSVASVSSDSSSIQIRIYSMEEADAFGVAADVLLPNGETKRVILDINSLVKEELNRILKGNNLPTQKPYRVFMKELNEEGGKFTELDKDQPFTNYTEYIAQNHASLEIREQKD